MLLAPVFLALLHQHELGGDRCRPLDLDHYRPREISGVRRMAPG